jgi:hypothetical protein
MGRRESYGDGIEVPGPAVILTAGVDVQVDRLELQVVGWAEHLERWVIAMQAVDGNPRERSTWVALADRLGYQTPYVVLLPDNSIALPTDTLTVNGTLALQIGGVLGGSAWDITTRLVCKVIG